MRIWTCLICLLPVLNACKNESTSSAITPEAIAEEMESLDQTTWKDEVAAQDYERFFVKLWDTLRGHEDPFSILATIPIQSITLPAEGEPELLLPLHSITRTQLNGSQTIITGSEFQQRIDLYKRAGWELAQTEWHHSAFTPARESRPARSTVSFVFHVIRGSERMIIRGEFLVIWSSETSPGGIHIPGSIDVSKAEILRRTKVETVQRLPLNLKAPPDRSVFVRPVLVEDLDKDGTIEVVLAGVNKVLRYGEKMEIAPFLRVPPAELTPAGVLADFDGDGQHDFLCVDANGTLLLYRGSDKGTFENRPAEAWIGGTANEALLLAAGDIEGDGDLDVWLAQYRMPYLEARLPSPFHDANDGAPSYLLRNDGGKFTDITESAQLAAKRKRRTLSASFIDYDGDGDSDLVTVNDFSGIDIHENQGDGSFKEVTASRIDERALFGMGHQFVDLNHDERPDFFAIGMSSTTVKRLESLKAGREDFEAITAARVPMTFGNRMYLWEGDGWKQTEQSTQVARTGWTWGSTFFDFDNDGRLDITLCNGQFSGKSCKDYCTRYWTHDIYMSEISKPDSLRTFLLNNEINQQLFRGDMSWNGYEHNVLYLEDQNGNYVNVAWLFDLALETDHRAVLAEDINQDGRLDLLKVDTQIKGNIELEEQRFTAHLNPVDTGNHWIGVRVRSDVPKRHAIGGRIVMQVDGKTTIRWLVTGEAGGVQSAPAMHLGLGENSNVDWIKVIWSDGIEQQIDSPQVDQWHLIEALKD